MHLIRIGGQNKDIVCKYIEGRRSAHSPTDVDLRLRTSVCRKLCFHVVSKTLYVPECRRSGRLHVPMMIHRSRAEWASRVHTEWAFRCTDPTHQYLLACARGRQGMSKEALVKSDVIRVIILMLRAGIAGAVQAVWRPLPALVHAT